MKVRPGTTTVAAKESLPTKESNLAAVVSRAAPTCWSNARISVSLSAGKRASIFTVSREMPRKVSSVTGPSSFSRASGTPR